MRVTAQVGERVQRGDGDVATLTLREQRELCRSYSEFGEPLVDDVGDLGPHGEVKERLVEEHVIARYFADPLSRIRPMDGLKSDRRDEAVLATVQSPRATERSAVSGPNPVDAIIEEQRDAGLGGEGEAALLHRHVDELTPSQATFAVPGVKGHEGPDGRVHCGDVTCELRRPARNDRCVLRKAGEREDA